MFSQTHFLDLIFLIFLICSKNGRFEDPCKIQWAPKSDHKSTKISQVVAAMAIGPMAVDTLGPTFAESTSQSARNCPLDRTWLILDAFVPPRDQNFHQFWTDIQWISVRFCHMFASIWTCTPPNVPYENCSHFWDILWKCPKQCRTIVLNHVTI